MNFSFASKRFLKRLGHHNALGGPLFVVASAFIVLLSFAFDAVRLGNYTWLWIPANGLAIAIALLPILPAVLIKRKKNVTQESQPRFNIIVSCLFFGIKNLSMIYITPLFGIVDDGLPGRRFIGGLIVGFVVLVLYTNVVGNRFERESGLVKLEEIESELLGFREVAYEQLEDESREAALKTVKALSPQIEELQTAVKESEDIVSLTKKLSNFITMELRPFSASLSNEAINLSRKAQTSDEAQRVEPEITVNLSKSIRLWNSLIPVPVLFYLIASFAIPEATEIDVLAVSLVFLVTLFAIKLSVLKLPYLSVKNAFIASTIVAFVSGTPALFMLFQIPISNGVPELLPAFLIIQGWSVLAASQAHILDLKQSAIEDQLNDVIDELARENKLYEQKAWLARHGWYLLLHGVVQPALTSASIRASNSEALTPSVRQAILEDLERALGSLKKGHSTHQSLPVSISEIQSVWQGICDIAIKVSPAVQEIADQSEVVSQVINEILKEVVSNAVRHGNATNIQASVSLVNSSNLSVLVENDGLKPTKDKIESVGSRMLDALCLDRTLSWNQETQRTEFKAVVPL